MQFFPIFQHIFCIYSPSMKPKDVKKSPVRLGLKEAQERQSFIDKQKFAIANYISSWTLNIQTFTWF